MATLQNRIEGIISTYNKKPFKLHETDETEGALFIGLRTFPNGFYTYTIHQDGLQKYFSLRRIAAERSGYTKELSDIVSRCVTVDVECLYDTGMRTSYSAPLHEIKTEKGTFVPLGVIKQDAFLKKLFETEEPQEAYQAGPASRINELGIDESELLEGLRSDNEESKQNEFDNENIIDSDF